MSRCSSGTKAAERRLRKYARAQARSAKTQAERAVVDARLAAQEEARAAAKRFVEEATAERTAIYQKQLRAAASVPAQRRRKTAAEQRAEAFAARKAEQEAAQEAAARAAERAAWASIGTRSVAPVAPAPSPALPTRRPPAPPRVTLHDRGGWWEAVVHLRNSFVSIPFYERERPATTVVAQAVADELNRRLRMALGGSAATPRKPKAPAAVSKRPQAMTTKIRRIERQMEGV